MLDIQKIKDLRDETGAGMLEVKQTLADFDGDYDKAKAELMSRAAKKAAKKADRTANDGLIYAYIHNNGKVGSLVHVACETDFVAKTEDFQKLCKEISMQVCTDDYADIESLLEAEYMRSADKKIKDLITDTTAKLGEKIELVNFIKYSVR